MSTFMSTISLRLGTVTPVLVALWAAEGAYGQVRNLSKEPDGQGYRGVRHDARYSEPGFAAALPSGCYVCISKPHIAFNCRSQQLLLSELEQPVSAVFLNAPLERLHSARVAEAFGTRGPATAPAQRSR